MMDVKLMMEKILNNVFALENYANFYVDDESRYLNKKNILIVLQTSEVEASRFFLFLH